MTPTKMTKTPSRNWTKVPVFCSGEKHEIWWDETGRLRLPHHTSIDTAAIEARLMRSGQLPDELCYVFAGAVRGSMMCLEILRKSMRFLNPQLVAHIKQMATKAQGRQTAQQERDIALLEHYPLTLEKCRKLFEATGLGRLDTDEGRIAQVTKKLVLVRTNMSGQPLLRVGIWGSTLRIEIGIDPKLWAGLHAKNKVILYDPNTDHPSKIAFALMPGMKRGFLFCVRYKQFITPHELELAHARVRRLENAWSICDVKTYL